MGRTVAAGMQIGGADPTGLVVACVGCTVACDVVACDVVACVGCAVACDVVACDVVACVWCALACEVVACVWCGVVCDLVACVVEIVASLVFSSLVLAENVSTVALGVQLVHKKLLVLCILRLIGPMSRCLHVPKRARKVQLTWSCFDLNRTYMVVEACHVIFLSCVYILKQTKVYRRVDTFFTNSDQHWNSAFWKRKKQTLSQ